MFKIKIKPLGVKSGVYFKYTNTINKILHIYPDSSLAIAYKYNGKVCHINSSITTDIWLKAVASGAYVVISEDEVLIPELKELKCW